MSKITPAKLAIKLVVFLILFIKQCDMYVTLEYYLVLSSIIKYYALFIRFHTIKRYLSFVLWFSCPFQHFLQHRHWYGAVARRRLRYRLRATKGLITANGVNRMADRWYAIFSSLMIKVSGTPPDNFECCGCRSRVGNNSG